MSRGICNRASQAQKLKLSKQDSAASKGVNYCKKCERRRERKKKKILNPVYDDPPLSLVILWFVVCYGFYRPDLVAFYTSYINYFASIILSTFVLIDFVLLTKSWIYRLFIPVLNP
jgi:hypothetical protein